MLQNGKRHPPECQRGAPDQQVALQDDQRYSGPTRGAPERQGAPQTNM